MKRKVILQQDYDQTNKNFHPLILIQYGSHGVRNLMKLRVKTIFSVIIESK